ncbi:prepilin-type N-terminal cleavage/methylation domain-containing protein [Puniceicoccus vermicola]|uniref:Prepilin-type N-terminal cleavage/methylation domain-containing protein n=1 Tax=Puniceicoccus vermicola TaxID=388746 RepID=A0A7X1B0Y1_9BACT|nr:prepilin-type N-terminal cleavage/methylation domain-containing protein [Puniceicoccus vermicola]MBC2603569.1 prepilin-type N-terminal cleavage/methylation domain-containing protein [Puniceicoccus vermicola]
MNKSKKGFTLVEIMIVVVIIGLLAAMAIPAFQKVRENSQQKTVLNNLRQIASGGQQYILEKGTDNASFSALEGVYFPTIKTVAGEDYSGLTVSSDSGSLSIDVAGKTIVYTY